MRPDDVQLLRRTWAAFARGDVDAAAAALHPDVRWHAAEDPGANGGCADRAQARTFMEQTMADGVTAELLDVHDAGERLVLTVRTHAPAEWGRRDEPHGEVVTIRDGLITEIVVHPTVEAAMAAATTP